MLVVAGLLVAFLLVVIYGNRATRACRWREDRARSPEAGTLYRCAACGAEAVTRTGQPPKSCFKDEGGRS